MIPLSAFFLVYSKACSSPYKILRWQEGKISNFFLYEAPSSKIQRITFFININKEIQLKKSI